MRLHSALFGGVVATVLATSAPESSASPRKCPPAPVRFPDAPEDVFVLNATAVDRETVLPLDPASVESIDVICANDLYDVFGYKARRGGVVVFTAPGPHTALDATMQRIRSLQQSHHVVHGRFAKTAAELGWADPTGMISVTVSVSEDGARWFASGTHRHRPQAGIWVEGGKPPA